jgi:hypothetical protein
LNIHYVKISISNGGGGITAKGRPLANMAHLKTIIVEVKAVNDCLAHALMIAIAKLTNDPDYKTFCQGRMIHPVLDRLIATTGTDMTNGGGVPQLIRIKEHFREYRIVVFGGLNCYDTIFDGQVESEKRINLYYNVTHHYYAINSVTGAFAHTVCL